LVNDFNNTASHNNIDFNSKSGDITKPTGFSEGVFEQNMNKLFNTRFIIEAKKDSKNSIFHLGHLQQSNCRKCIQTNTLNLHPKLPSFLMQLPNIKVVN